MHKNLWLKLWFVPIVAMSISTTKLHADELEVTPDEKQTVEVVTDAADADLTADEAVEEVQSEVTSTDTVEEVTQEAATTSSDDDGEDFEGEVEDSPSLKERLTTWLVNKYNEANNTRKYGAFNAAPENADVIMAALAELEAAHELDAEALEEKIRQEAAANKLYEDSLHYLALNGFYESRDQTATQELAVNCVVLNRLSVGFNNSTTIREVILDPDQFSWVRTYGTELPELKNKRDEGAWNRSLLLAQRLMHPLAPYVDASHGATFYYNPTIVKERTGKDWKYAKFMDHVAQLGDHRFMAARKDNKYYIDPNKPRINPILFNGLSAEERKELIEGK